MLSLSLSNVSCSWIKTLPVLTLALALLGGVIGVPGICVDMLQLDSDALLHCLCASIR